MIITGETDGWDGLVACGQGLVLVLPINGTRELFVPGLTGGQAGMMERVARGTSLDDKDYQSQLIALTSTCPNTLNYLKSINVAYKSRPYFSCDRPKRR